MNPDNSWELPPDDFLFTSAETAESQAATGPSICPEDALLDAYSQAWGLFCFLFERHRGELKEYMSQLSGSWFAPQDEQSMKRRFVSVFGPLEALEKDFRQFIDDAAHKQTL